jgi:hypothetical protein
MKNISFFQNFKHLLLKNTHKNNIRNLAVSKKYKTIKK